MEQNLEILKECPICSSHDLGKGLEIKDFFLSQEKFGTSKCKSCGFVFTNPRPKEADLGQYYKSEAYISHSNSNKGLFGFLYQTIRNYTLKQKYKKVSAISNGKHILDIGCATGQLLNEFNQHHWHCTGIEPDAEAREFATKEYGLNVLETERMVDLEDQSFHIISMWHVLEHVANLKERMAQLKRLISPDGYLFIALPNIESWDAQHYQEYWAGLDVPRHLFHFSKDDVKLLFSQYDFEIVDIQGMKFDSYYVSLLSEKYKKNPLYLFSAFFKGWYSNLKANKKTANHSSLLYILKPKQK